MLTLLLDEIFVGVVILCVFRLAGLYQCLSGVQFWNSLPSALLKTCLLTHLFIQYFDQ